MGMVRIKKTDMAEIKAYSELSGAFVRHEGGCWIISTPEDTILFDNTADLMKDIRANLKEMRELVESGQLEKEIWEAAWSN